MIKTLGQIRLQVKRMDEVVHDTGWIKNVITNAGKAAMAGLTGNTGGLTAFTYLALGTSATAVNAADTQLTAEIVDTGLQRASASVSRVTTSVANDTLQFTNTFTATGAKTVNEAGIGNNASANTGQLLSHVLTGAITLANTDQLVVTYKIQFS